MGRPGTAIPRRNAFVDPRSLPIGSIEGFLLSCIDGKATLDELADLSGLSRAQLEAAIARLAELGAIVVEEPTGASAGATVSPRTRRLPSGVRAPIAKNSGEQALDDDAVELSPERRKAVLEVFERLDRVDYYGILGVPNTADKHEVRDAYFKLSKLVHPDTMYGKQLGSYKAKMEAVFKRATEAYETLSKRKRRDDYDARIGLPILEARLEGAERASAETTPSPVPAAPSREGARISSVRPRPSVDGKARDGGGSPEPLLALDDARLSSQQRFLEQVAQRTGKPSTFPPAKPVDRSPSNGAVTTDDAILRGLVPSALDAGRSVGQERIQELLRTAATAEKSGDLLAAVNTLRIAHEAAPDREDIFAQYRRVRFTFARSQADAYEKQAVREERMEMWGAAASSWSRVAEGRPDSSHALRHAAHCMLAAGGDMKRARDLAQRAVELAPRDIAARITLGRVYLAAGMKLNARRELETAAKLDPKDEFVKNLLREMKP